MTSRTYIVGRQSITVRAYIKRAGLGGPGMPVGDLRSEIDLCEATLIDLKPHSAIYYDVNAHGPYLYAFVGIESEDWLRRNGWTRGKG